MLTALATNFKQLLFFRAAEGLGETFYFPASMSMISDYHGKKSRHARWVFIRPAFISAR